MKLGDSFLWVEKYRPTTVADCILPDDLKQLFQSYVDDEEIPNLILSGSPGTGKTTVAKAMCLEIGTDGMYLNCSKERGIDTIRTKISQFAGTVSLSGKRKVIILDEADGLTGEAQDALRAAIEEYSRNCSFIFTCNHKNKLHEAIHSRSAVIDFKIKASEKPALAMLFYKRIKDILGKEGIAFDSAVVQQVILKYFPDYRRTLGELQRYSKSGSIDAGILARFSENTIKELVENIKDKNFAKCRKWVGENSDIDYTQVFRELYDTLYDKLTPESVPQAVLTLADYQYKNAFAADPQLNLMAAIISLMVDTEFK